MPPILQIKQDISYALRKLTSEKKKSFSYQILR